MSNHTPTYKLQDHPLHQAIYNLCQQIEKCGASEELTRAVIMATDLQPMVVDLRAMPSRYMNFVVKNGFDPVLDKDGNVYFTLPEKFRKYANNITSDDLLNHITMLHVFYELGCLSGIEDPEQWVADMKAENQRLKDLVSDLAAWSNKYPREITYSMGLKSTMDNELIAMEERAKALLETNKTEP